MKKNLTVMMIVLGSASLVMIVSLLFFPRTARHRTAEILSVSGSGEELIEIDATSEKENEGVTLLEAYQASLDRQGVAYCLVYRIDAGTEGEFEIAVGVDMSGTRVLGVCLLSDSLLISDGSYVSWAKYGYLDVYSGLARKQIDTVEPLSTASVSTQRILDAVKEMFETVDVIKESEDTYE